MLVTAPTVVDYGGVLKTTNTSRFVLNEMDEQPLLGTNHIGRTRTILSPLIQRQAQPRLHWLPNMSYPGSIQSIACSVESFSGVWVSTPEPPYGSYQSTLAGVEQPQFAIFLRVHDGSRLTSVMLSFRIPSSQQNIAPLQMPKMRIIRVSKDGDIVSMRSVTSGADVNGFVSMPSVGAAVWFAEGASQTFEYTCDQNNTIDTSLYTYYAQLVEEIGTTIFLPSDAPGDGAVIRKRKINVVRVYTTNTGLIGVPGGLVSGDAVLLVGQTLAYNNGTWIVQVGAWARQFDTRVSSDFTPNFLVTDASTWETWECTSPSFTGSQNFKIDIFEALVVDSANTPITFQRRTPRGNIYHSLACHFDQIIDMRPQ